MKITTYSSLLTHKRTWVIVSSGKCGYKDYVEYQIRLTVDGTHWIVDKSDGYHGRLVGMYPSAKGLKSVINLVWGK